MSITYSPTMDDKCKETDPCSQADNLPSAQLILDSIRWEFETEDKRHDSFTTRATVLLGVDATILTVMFTGVSFLLADPPSLAGLALTWGLRLLLLITAVIVASGILATLAITTRNIEMPNVDSLLDPSRYITAPDVVACNFAEAYGTSVRSHRKKGQRMARQINASAYLLLTGLFSIGILVAVVVMGRR